MFEIVKMTMLINLMLNYQGKYLVIFISFKDVKRDTWEDLSGKQVEIAAK